MAYIPATLCGIFEWKIEIQSDVVGREIVTDGKEKTDSI